MSLSFKETPLILAALLLVAAAPPKQAAPGLAQYRACITKVQTDPKAAVQEASVWRDQGGGAAAKQCLGLAFISLDQPKNAAAAFTQAAQDMEQGRGLAGGLISSGPSALAGLYGQAGNAALIAGDPAQAYALLSRAIDFAKLLPEVRGDLLVDRARAAVELRDYKSAVADLERAAKLLPTRSDVWLLSATAKRYLRDLTGAEADIAKAVSLRPTDPDVLLERGAILALKGDMASARKDWQTIIAAAPKSSAAKSARADLEASGLQ